MAEKLEKLAIHAKKCKSSQKNYIKMRSPVYILNNHHQRIIAVALFHIHYKIQIIYINMNPGMIK